MYESIESARCSGFGDTTKTLLFANHPLCRAEFKTRGKHWSNETIVDNDELVQGSLSYMPCDITAYIDDVELTSRDDLYLISDSPRLAYNSDTNEYIEEIQFYFSRKHSVVLAVDMTKVCGGQRVVCALYAPYDPYKLERISAINKKYLTFNNPVKWESATDDKCGSKECGAFDWSLSDAKKMMNDVNLKGELVHGKL